jgi:hypothetical protein
MQALRLHEVLTRVVAWHNRHPFARRINASQVHSIGEVLLPFASAAPLPGAEAPAPQADTRHPPAEAAPTLPANLAPPARPDAADPTTSAAAAPSPATDDAAVELEIDIDLPGVGTTVAATATTDAPNAQPSSAHDETAAAASASPAEPPVDGPTPAGAEPSPGAAPADAPPVGGLRRRAAQERATQATAQPAAAQAATPSPRQPAQGMARRLEALLAFLRGRQPGMPRLKAAFSRDFIWPLTPAQVARWTQRHGQAQPIAPPDWPRRWVDTDAQRLARARQQGLPHLSQLHVLTAAIGVGDRRIRVLMDARGNVIGPRAYSRQRLGTVASLLLLAAVGTAGPLWWPVVGRAGQAMASVAAAAASAADAAASAPAPPTESNAAVAAAAPHDPAAAHKAGTSQAASTVHDEVAAHAPTSPASAAPEPPAAAPAPAPAATELAAASSPPEAPVVATETASRAPMPRIRPMLSDEDKRIAREQAERLRASPPVAASAPAADAAPVYAVVSRPSRQRETAANSLVLMRAAGAQLPPPVPGRGELMQSQGEWRAAWWPFTTLADAERARVLLAGRGLKAEVVEF